MEFFNKVISWLESILQKFLDLIGIHVNVRYVLISICICCIVSLLVYAKTVMGI